MPIPSTVWMLSLAPTRTSTAMTSKTWELLISEISRGASMSSEERPRPPLPLPRMRVLISPRELPQRLLPTAMSGRPRPGCLSELMAPPLAPSLLCIRAPRPPRAETDVLATYGLSSPKEWKCCRMDVVSRIYVWAGTQYKTSAGMYYKTATGWQPIPASSAYCKTAAGWQSLG